jgi:hypothetical protein
MEEVWKPVPTKQGIFASSFGRYKLPERTAIMPHGMERVYKTKPCYGTKTKASKTARHEYYSVYSRMFGNLKVHHLVCEAFHGPKPFPRAVVIHINENALDNRPENLRWGTQKENLNMPKFIEYCRSRTGDNNPRVKGMAQKNVV